MYQPTLWIPLLLLTVLSHPLAQAAPLSKLSPVDSRTLAASRGLTATATATRPVVVGQGSSTSAPSLAPGGLYLSVVIGSTLVSSTTTSASLKVSAVCEGTEIDPLEVPPLQVSVPLPGARATASSSEVDIELLWDGGRRELSDSDYYADRSYSCTATVQLTATSSRRTKTTTATAAATYWDVLLAEQAVTIPTTEPTNGDEVNSATFETSSLDGTVGTVPVSIGIAPETIVTVDGQALPPDSTVNISMDQPTGADIPSGITTPLFAASVVRLGPEGARFDPPVTLGLTLSGPLANTQNPIPLTYSEVDEDWIDCRTNDSCTPVECPVATGFDDGMICLEVHHFSLWTLGSDQQIALQLDLMDGNAVAPSWKCAPDEVCPPNLQFNSKVFSRAAQPSGELSARMRVCIDNDGDASCSGAKDKAISGLDVANPECYSGTKCKATGAYGTEPTSGSYDLILRDLANPSWNSLQTSVNTREVYLALGYDDTKLPTKVTASSHKTHCPGNPSIGNSETLFDCLNLGVMPKLDQATFDPTPDTLTATTSTSFGTSANLKAGTLTLYWANADQCEETWNPAGAPTLALISITSSSVTATATSLNAVNVRTKITNSTYGTVLGPCVSVTALDTDGDGFTEAQGDCDDTSPDSYPNAPETCDWKDNNCDGVADEGVWFKKVAAGLSHTVGLCSDGTAWAWGQGASYQLGTGHRKPEGSPARVVVGGDSEPTAIDVAAANSATFIVYDDGTLWSVGGNSSGILGLGLPTTESAVSPQQVPLEDVVAVDAYGSWAGPVGAIALTGAGQVYAWGSNTYGILGTSEITSSSSPVPITFSPDVKVIKVRYSSTHALALDDLGQVWAWGSNAYGQLGQTDFTLQVDPSKIEGLPWVRDIDAAANISGALTEDGELFLWGANDLSGTGGNPETPALASIPLPVQTFALNAGWGIPSNGLVVAVLEDRSVWAWGNSYYFLGIGSATPVKVDNAQLCGATNNGQDISLATSTDWAVLACLANEPASGELWQWGSNWNKPFIPVAAEVLEPPTEFEGVSGVTDVEMGSNALYLVGTYGDRSDSIWSLGYNLDGQLGDGGDESTGAPVRVDLTVSPVSVSRGEGRAFSIDSDGRLWGWGNNNDCELGTGNTVPHPKPVESLLNALLAADERRVTDVSGGIIHTVALDNMGRLWIWGIDTVGQMGGVGSHCAPALLNDVLENDLPAIKDVHATFNYTLALSTEGDVYSWGENLSGQLGDGTKENRSTPKRIEGLPVGSVASITSGYGLAFAVLKDEAPYNGQVYSWGCGGSALGRGSLLTGCSTPSTPAPVLKAEGQPLEHVKQVAGTMALVNCQTITGCELWGWGSGYPSLLGQPDNQAQFYAIQIVDLYDQPITGIVDVSQTSMMAVALKTDGTVFTWGWDFQAQVTEDVDYWWLKEPTRAFPE